MDVTGGMRRLTCLASSVNVENVRRTSAAMMKPSLESLEAAVDHTVEERFGEALEQNVSTSNACHAAIGSGFVQGSLDLPSKLSLRHPHVLRPRAAPGDTHERRSAHEAGEHGHGHEAVDGEGHGGEEGKGSHAH